MKYILILALILTGCSSGGGSSGEHKEQTILVLGDSLCSSIDSWAYQLTQKTEVVCISGYRAAEPEYDDVVSLSTSNVFINATGGNDAFAMMLGEGSLEDFRIAYKHHNDTAMRKGMRVICLMPPLTQRAELQPYIMQIWDVIQDLCPAAIHGAESDWADGVHYTDNAQSLNLQIINNAL